MSFSSEIKEEISKINNLKNKEEVIYEFVGYLITANVYEKGKFLEYSTENEYNINRFNKLLNNLQIDYDIKIKGKTFIIKFNKEIPLIKKEEILKSLIKENIKENLVKAFVRGSFLGSGSINNPNNKYHMEVVLKNKENLEILNNQILKYKINLKELRRKNTYSLYTKEGEEISKFLALIGANSSVIKFEEIRVLRDIRNNINRKVNCETANLNKTVNAAVKQIDNIKLIYKMNKQDKLSDNLKEIAKLRLENPDASLIELGNMLSTPLGKSGVNYRLKKIEEIAEELRSK